MIEEMSARYPRPDWVRRINAMGDSFRPAMHSTATTPDHLFQPTGFG
jgi:hypothetical protein